MSRGEEEEIPFQYGTLFALGSNGAGQLGVPKAGDLSSPRQTVNRIYNPVTDIKHIAAGGNHTLVLYHDGTIKSMGCNADGRCGVPKVREIRPPLVAFHEHELHARQGWPDRRQDKFAHVSATWAASILVYEGGKVFTAGSGDSGEMGLGFGVTGRVDATPNSAARQIPDFPPQGTSIVHINSSMAHTVVVLSNGEVWGWGKGRKGQLGEPAEDVWTPRKIEGVPFPVVKAACGKDFTCLVGNRENGELLVLGSKDNDRFGVRSNAPKAVPGWVDIAASWGSIYVLREDGSILAWGRDDHGQLPPPGLPAVKAIAAGSEHCLALTGAGKVLAWGWGEHGNCGEPTDERGDVKGRWNEIGIPGKVHSIYAGCATSFIATIPA